MPTISFNQLASLTSLREAPNGSIKPAKPGREGCSTLPRTRLLALVAGSPSRPVRSEVARDSGSSSSGSSGAFSCRSRLHRSVHEKAISLTDMNVGNACSTRLEIDGCQRVFCDESGVRTSKPPMLLRNCYLQLSRRQLRAHLMLRGHASTGTGQQPGADRVQLSTSANKRVILIGDDGHKSEKVFQHRFRCAVGPFNPGLIVGIGLAHDEDIRIRALD